MHLYVEEMNSLGCDQPKDVSEARIKKIRGEIKKAQGPSWGGYEI